MRVLVTGGAGFIGSATVRLLREAGHPVAVVDNLSTGSAAFLPADVPFWHTDLGQRHQVQSIFAEFQPTHVLHLAASAIVAESVVRPARYWRNNVLKTLVLLEVMVRSQVPALVFSSTCAVYRSSDGPLTEAHTCLPHSPYGWSKFWSEQTLWRFAHRYGLHAVVLRYFNVAGSAWGVGEARAVETHLIPRLLELARQQRGALTLCGTDYPTADGTAVRDYVHLHDVAQANLLALEATSHPIRATFNVGTGTGTSVRDLVALASEVTHHRINTRPAARRPGDPATMIADPTRIRDMLGWQPRYTLGDILQDAWHWHQARASVTRPTVMVKP